MASPGRPWASAAMLALGDRGLQMNGLSLWPLPLPLVFLGLGLMLYYALASDRTR